MENLEIVYEGNLATCANGFGQKIRTQAKEFSPLDLLALSLGSCLLTIMGIEAQKLGVNLRGSSVKVERSMSQDWPRRISSMKVEFSFDGKDISLQARAQLERAGMSCPVYYSLSSEMKIHYIFHWEGT